MRYEEILQSLEEPLLEECETHMAELRQFDFHAGYFLFNEFGSNRVTTSMYTIWTFFPKFLGQTFSKKNNVYFLFICALEMTPGISTSSGIPTTALPLLMVSAVDACFRLVEDYARQQDDEKANNRTTNRIGPASSVESITWANVRVGDVIHINNGDLVPADLILLRVDESQRTFCYLETASLDGETNLKMRQALTETQSLEFDQLHGRIQCDPPSSSTMHSFSGTLLLADQSMAIPISQSNVLLRGCVLRNTQSILGVVFNTGHDTKVMQCAATCPSKQSRIDGMVNHELMYIFLLTVLFCGFAGAVSTAFDDFELPRAWYLHATTESPSALMRFIASFLRFFLMLSNVVPISLYVTLNIVKSLQAKIIDADMQIADGGTRCKVKTMALNDDLGQISHIVTDKTGTLTRNVMVFRSCSIQGSLYGMPMHRRPSPPALQMKWLEFSDPVFTQKLKSSSSGIHAFLLHLALSHSVLAEAPTSFQDLAAAASSPDEQALLAMAYAHGYKFLRRSPGKTVLQIPGHDQPVEFNIVHVLEFTSQRKRMSVVVRNPLKQNSLELLIKGADSVILPRARQGSPHIETTQNHLKQLAQAGLRTLVIASRTLEDATYTSWHAEYNAACRDLSQLQLHAKNEPNLIDKLMDNLEQDLEILGATGIEDGLQDDVPKSIEKLRLAGIKIWMLTGDHVDTAVNVARGSNLLKNTAVQLMLVNPSIAGVNSDLQKFQNQILPWQKYALVIDGETLQIVLAQARTVSTFIQIVQACEVVLACRVSPIQKAQIVSLIKLHMDGSGRVLAIGDGANDVAMLQCAHVGVGISGQEGMQAANCSDYSIAQFSFLVRLLFVHGRRNYMRIGFLIPYVFYKNTLLVMSEFWYCMVNGVSGQKFYNQVAVDFFNTFYTALPVIIFAVYDKDLPSWLCERLPNLYAEGLNRSGKFRRRVIWKWMIFGLVESFIISMVSILSMSSNDVQGRPFGMWECGALTFTQIVLVVNYKLALYQNTWKWMQVAALGISIILWFVSGFILSASPGVSFQWFDIFPIVMGSNFYWFASLIIPVMALSYDFVSNAIYHSFSPSNERVLQEALQMPGKDDPDLHLRLLTLPQKQPAPSSGFAMGYDQYTASVEAQFCRTPSLNRRKTVH